MIDEIVSNLNAFDRERKDENLLIATGKSEKFRNKVFGIAGNSLTRRAKLLRQLKIRKISYPAITIFTRQIVLCSQCLHAIRNSKHSIQLIAKIEKLKKEYLRKLFSI